MPAGATAASSPWPRPRRPRTLPSRRPLHPHRDHLPALALAAGLATFAAALGAGLLALGALRVRPPAPWREVAALLLGLAIESALVQGLAMAGASTRPALVALWGAFVVVGLAGVARARTRGELRVAPPCDDWRPRGAAAWVPLVLGVAALAANLLLAVAPSTKIDELYYHMLLPRRIVEDGALRFYQLPWEAAAVPQMAYQIGAAPLHALGVPDAPNVTSWMLGATLAWLGWFLLARDDDTRPLASWWVAVATVGLYTAVWHVTGGAHALGDLALAAAVVVVADGPTRRDAWRERAAAPDYALVVGVTTWAAASAKATVAPAAAALLLWGTATAWRRAATPRQRAAVCAAALAPWVAFALPLVAWTWRASGAPYGPFFAWWFPGTAYDAGGIRDALAATAAANRRLPYSVPRELIARNSPLLWLAAAGAFGCARRAAGGGATRLALAGVVALQAVLVFGLVSWDPRFLSGALYGLALLGALWCGRAWARAVPRRPRATAIASAVLLAPWLAAQLYYGAPFFGVALGLEPRQRVLRRFVALWDDYRALDRILPRDALLVASVGRVSAFYAPRPMLFSTYDLRGARDRQRAYVVALDCAGAADARRGPVVYENPRAVIAVYRTPGHPPDVHPLCVWKLEGGRTGP